MTPKRCCPQLRGPGRSRRHASRSVSLPISGVSLAVTDSAHGLKSGQQVLIHRVLLEVYRDIRHDIVDDRAIDLGLFVGTSCSAKRGPDGVVSSSCSKRRDVGIEPYTPRFCSTFWLCQLISLSVLWWTKEVRPPAPELHTYLQDLLRGFLGDQRASTQRTAATRGLGILVKQQRGRRPGWCLRGKRWQHMGAMYLYGSPRSGGPGLYLPAFSCIYSRQVPTGGGPSDFSWRLS